MHIVTDTLGVWRHPDNIHNMFVPAEWQSLIHYSCRKNAFTVRDMKAEDFLAINELTKNVVNCKTKKDKEFKYH